MTDKPGVASEGSRLETQSIIAALKKGADELSKTLPQGVNPTFFAWSQVDGSASLLKARMSETGEAFVPHSAQVLRPRKTTAGAGERNPLPMYDEFTAAGWQSESHASMASPMKEKKIAEEPAGFEHFAGVKQPPSFAWTRLDEATEEPPALAPASVPNDLVEMPAEISDSAATLPPPPPPSAPKPDNSGPPALDPEASGVQGWASEYASRFPLYSGMERPATAKQSSDVSLAGIFSYQGVGVVKVSEYDEKIVLTTTAASETVSSTANDVAPDSESTHVPASDLSSNAAPVGSEVISISEPEPAIIITPDTVSTSVVAQEPMHRTLSHALDHTNAAQLFAVPESSNEPKSKEAKAAAAALYCSEAHARFSWPGGAPVLPPPPPARDATPNLPIPPVDHDLIAGTMQTSNIQPVANQEPLQKQLAKGNKEKFVSEAHSKFAWPEKSMTLLNRQAAMRKPRAAGADLWVMGHKGTLAPTPLPAPPATEDAGCQTGASTLAPEASSAMLDAMEKSFQPAPSCASSVASAPTTSEKASQLEHPVLESRRIPGLREEPVNPTIVHRNRPKEFAQPELPYFPTTAPMRYARPNPEHVLVHGASQQRSLMPAEPALDPVLAYRRYPVLTDKQTRRWSTESKEQFTNKFKIRR